MVLFRVCRLVAEISMQAVLFSTAFLEQNSLSLLLFQCCAHRSREEERGVQVTMMAGYKMPGVTHVLKSILQKFPS